MAANQINGSTQIKAATVPLSALVTGYSIPTGNLAQGSLFVQSGGSVAMTASFNAGSNTVINVATPVNGTDAVNKAYVDAKVGGIGGFHDVRILSNANIGSLSGLSAVDGVTPVAGDVLLLIAQTTASQNGPWTAASGAWTRPSWWAGGSVVNEGQYFVVAEGTTFKNTKFFCTTTGTITVDTTSVNFAQDLSGTTYSAGTGLQLVGSVFSVLYGTTGTTAAVGNDSRITGALQTSALGTGVQTALGVNLNTGAGLLGLSGGVVPAAQFPTLSGDVTTPGSSLTTTVNNTSGSGFTKYTNFVFNEVPGGAINGANTSFTLVTAPANSSADLMLFKNGMLLLVGSGNDFTISGSTITMLTAPATGDQLLANYMK